MNLVERMNAILLTPKTEWEVIDRETGDQTYLFTNYVAILAAVPTVAVFIGYSLFSMSSCARAGMWKRSSSMQSPRRLARKKTCPAQ
jgi:hypothetical protein